jgi:hypothetical protein
MAIWADAGRRTYRVRAGRRLGKPCFAALPPRGRLPKVRRVHRKLRSGGQLEADSGPPVRGAGGQ